MKRVAAACQGRHPFPIQLVYKILLQVVYGFFDKLPKALLLLGLKAIINFLR